MQTNLRTPPKHTRYKRSCSRSWRSGAAEGVRDRTGPGALGPCRSVVHGYQRSLRHEAW